MDIIGVYSNPFIDGDKAVILLCQPHKFRHGHTAAQRLAICKGDVKIVGACDDGSDLVMNTRTVFLSLETLMYFCAGGSTQDVLQDTLDACREKGLVMYSKHGREKASGMNSGTGG